MSNTWSIYEDIEVLKFYFSNPFAINKDFEELRLALLEQGYIRSVKTIKARYLNYKYLSGQNGLSNKSYQEQFVYDCLKGCNFNSDDGRSINLHIKYDKHITLKELIDILESFRLAINDEYKNETKSKTPLGDHLVISNVDNGSIIATIATGVATHIIEKLLIRAGKKILDAIKKRLKQKKINANVEESKIENNITIIIIIQRDN